MKALWKDLWDNFIKPYLVVLIVICGICWLLTYPYLLCRGIFKWYDYIGTFMLALDALVKLLYKRSKFIRALQPFMASDRFLETLFCVVTLSNLIHIKEAWIIYCTVLKSKGILLAIYFFILGIYNYFTIPKD